VSPRLGLLLVLGVVLLGARPGGAQPLALQAFVDKTTIGDAEPVTLTVELRGGFRSLDRIEPPAVRGLALVQPRPAQEWARPRGGRTEQEVALRWTLEPTGSGSAEIGPVVLTVDGRRYTTDPIRVRVVPQRQRPATGGAPAPVGEPAVGEAPPEAPDLFLRAVPDRNTAYVGEQVVVDYVLHYAAWVHPRNARIGGAWDAPGFWREDLELPGPPVARPVLVDGVPYEAVTIKRSAFFPTRAGALTVDSLVIELEALRSQRPGGVYGPLYNPFGSRYERRRLAAPSVAITARPLPPGAPEAFRGGVGDFSLRVEVDRTEVAAGEPVRVSVILRGDGNPATLDPPAWSLAPPLETFVPRQETRTVRTETRLRGERRFTYTIVPRAGGEFVLPGFAWAFFDPETGAYRTATSDPVPLRVSGAAEPSAEASAPTTALAFRAEPGRWRRTGPSGPLYQRPAVLAAFGLPLLALVLLAGALRQRARRAEPSAHVRSLRAYPSARHALDAAERLRQRGERVPYLDALDRAVRGFLSERLGLAAHALSLEDLEASVRGLGVSEGTARDLRALLEAAEAGRFGPAGAGAPMPETEEVARLLAAVDAEASALQPEPV
jgi:hypothetical protein